MDGERALDPVDALDAVDRGRVVGDGLDVGDVGRCAGDVGEDDDRRRLTRGELGLERDVRVAALDTRRVDLGPRHALFETQERAAEEEQEGERRDDDGDRMAHDRVGDALPACGPGGLDAIGNGTEAMPQPAQ